MKTQIDNYINHVAFVLDASSSMTPFKSSVIDVVDKQIQHLARRSKEMDQETRVSVYVFADKVDCIVYDKDVLRLPSINKYYTPRGNTAIIDATLKSISDLEHIPTMYGDNSFLIYVISDGEQNAGVVRDHAVLSRKLNALGEHWTVVTLVPSHSAAHEAKSCGFAPQNIQIWDTNSSSFSETGSIIQKSVDKYLVARSQGVKGTKNLFALDSNALNSQTIKSKLAVLSPTKDYDIFPVRKDDVIKPFVESWTSQAYRLGSAYYQLTKPEKIQSSKNILIEDKKNGKVYSGNEARELLGLPDYEVKVNPLDHSSYNIYVQSSSVNRKLVNNTKLIILK